MLFLSQRPSSSRDRTARGLCIFAIFSNRQEWAPATTVENHFSTGQSISRLVSARSNILTWMVGWPILSCRSRVCCRNTIHRTFCANAGGSYDAGAAFGVGHELTNQLEYDPGTSNGDKFKDPPFSGKFDVLGATPSTISFSPRSCFLQAMTRTARIRYMIRVVRNLLQAPRMITVYAPYHTRKRSRCNELISRFQGTLC